MTGVPASGEIAACYLQVVLSSVGALVRLDEDDYSNVYEQLEPTGFFRRLDQAAGRVVDASAETFLFELDRWIRLIRRTSPAWKAIDKLHCEELFDAWFEQERSLGRSGSVGYRWPEDEDAYVGVLFGMYLALSKGKVPAIGTAAELLGESGVVPTPTMQKFNRTYFNALMEDIGGYLRRVNSTADTGEDLDSGEDEGIDSSSGEIVAVPASDRIVGVDHNNPQMQELESEISRIGEAVRGKNDFPDVEEQNRCLAEISAGAALLNAPRVSVAALNATLVRAFVWLAETFAHEAIGEMAKKAVVLVMALFVKV